MDVREARAEERRNAAELFDASASDVKDGDSLDTIRARLRTLARLLRHSADVELRRRG